MSGKKGNKEGNRLMYDHLSSEARHGAYLMRTRGGRMQPDNVTYWARQMALGFVREVNSLTSPTMTDTYDRPTWIPEKALDWPIIRAAFAVPA